MIGALLVAALALAAPASAPVPPDMTPRNATKWLLLHGDIAELGVHAEANRVLAASGDRRRRVVLLGDSITVHWPTESLPALDAVQIVNRGIAGQNTVQMLLRFEDDVAALAPAAVVILAGTNDLRIFSRPARPDTAMAQIARNVTAMADIADARRIRVVLCAIPPVGVGVAGRSRDPASIVAANDWLKSFAAARGYGFVDVHGILADGAGLLAPEHTSDGLHLTPAAYRKVTAQLREALDAALAR